MTKKKRTKAAKAPAEGHAGKARKDVLMIRARLVAKSGACTGWRHVVEVVERENPNDRALRIWATPADKFELDHLCEKARFALRESSAGTRKGKPGVRR